MGGLLHSQHATAVLMSAFLIVAILFTETNGDCPTGYTATLTASNSFFQFFSSPHYPNPYPNDVNCSWLIQTSVHRSMFVLQIVVRNLDIEWETWCNYDSVDIFDGDSRSSPRLAHLCGSFVNDNYPVYFSSGASIFVTFTSNRNQERSGFKIDYRAVGASQALNTTVRFQTLPLTPAWTLPSSVKTVPTGNYSCSGGEIRTVYATSSPTYIQSPNYPLSYYNNAYCSWEIRPAQPNYLLELTFISINLENEDSCAYDRIIVYEEGFELAGASFCGRYFSVQRFFSQHRGNFVKLVFKTDSSNVFDGFRVSVVALWNRTTVSNNRCFGGNGVTLPASINVMQQIVSPGYPTYNYTSNSHCDWLLQAPFGYLVHLKIYYLQIEYESTCNYDNLRVYDASYPHSNRMVAKLCSPSDGTIVRVGDYYSSGRSMYLLFSTDNSKQYAGFKVGYEAVNRVELTTYMPTALPRTCVSRNSGGITLTADYLFPKYIQSPNYPRYYPNHSDCAWTISALYGYVIHVRVDQMDLETTATCNNDAVTLYASTSAVSSSQIAKLCSAVANNNFYSQRSHMYITFISDGSNTRSGFRLMYEAVLQSEVLDPPDSSSGRSSSYSAPSRLTTGVVVSTVAAVIFVIVTAVIVVVKRHRTAAGAGSRPGRAAQPHRIAYRPSPGLAIQRPGNVYVTPLSGAGALGAGRTAGYNGRSNPAFSCTEFNGPPAYSDLYSCTGVFPNGNGTNLVSTPGSAPNVGPGTAMLPPSYDEVVRTAPSLPSASSAFSPPSPALTDILAAPSPSASTINLIQEPLLDC